MVWNLGKVVHFKNLSTNESSRVSRASWFRRPVTTPCVLTMILYSLSPRKAPWMLLPRAILTSYQPCGYISCYYASLKGRRTDKPFKTHFPDSSEIPLRQAQWWWWSKAPRSHSCDQTLKNQNTTPGMGTHRASHLSHITGTNPRNLRLASNQVLYFQV